MVTPEELETRLAALENLFQQLKLDRIAKALEEPAKKKSRSPRKTREYTEAERATIRERLRKGQEAARKKREAEAKANKKGKVDTSDKGKSSETDKQAKA